MCSLGKLLHLCVQCFSFQSVFTSHRLLNALCLTAFYVSAQYLHSEWLLGFLRSIIIQVMRIRNHHHETCFSAGITASICRSQVGYAWKLTSLVCLTLVFSECIVLFLGKLSAVVTNYDSTMVTRVVSLPLSGFSALYGLLLNKCQSLGYVLFLINYLGIGILA